MSKFSDRHKSLIHDLPCGVCGNSPVEGHHILEGRTPGRKSPDALMIPLCVSCHRDELNGIHGLGNMWKIYNVSELDVLAKTLEKLYGEK